MLRGMMNVWMETMQSGMSLVPVIAPDLSPLPIPANNQA